MDLNAKARALRDLHSASAILQVVNVWDAISAKAVAELPGTKALATAGHSIAATFGYPDGQIPLGLMLEDGRAYHLRDRPAGLGRPGRRP